MIPEDYVPILNRLQVRTAAGEVKWNQVSKGVFAVSFDEYSLSISEYVGGDDEGEDSSSIDFRLRNSQGEVIDAFDVWNYDSDYEVAWSMFNTVRRRALRIDEALARLSAALEAEQVVGVEDSLPDDSEIPF